MAEFISPESQELGGEQNIIARESLAATYQAFNALAEAEEIRLKIQASNNNVPSRIPFMYGPYDAMGSFSIVRPIANMLRQAKIERLEAKANNLLAPGDITN